MANFPSDDILSKMFSSLISIVMKFFTNLFPYAVVFTSSLFVPSDSDLGWHLKYGEYFFQTGNILRDNTFSSMMNNYHWANHSWGTDLITYQIFSRFSFLGLTIAGAIVITLIFYFINKTVKLNFWEKSVLFPLLLVLEEPLFDVSFRSQLLSLLGIAILCFLLAGWKKNKKYLFYLIILFFVWANIHGGFILGLMIFLIYISADYLQFILTKTSRSVISIETGILLGVFTLSVLISLINPFGIYIFVETFKHFGNPLQKYIIEWIPFDKFSFLWWKLVFWDILILISVLKLSEKKQLIQNLPWCIASILTLIMSFFARRYMWTLLILSVPVVKVTIASLRPKNIKFSNILSAVILIVVYAYVILIKAPSENIFSMNWDRYCSGFVGCSPQAAEFIIKNKLTDNFYSFYNWGGWLIWNYPGIKPNIDGRMTLWRDEFGYSAFEEYYPVEQNIKDIDKTSYDVVLITPLKPLYKGMIELVKVNKWKVLYSDKYAAVFGRIK